MLKVDKEGVPYLVQRVKFLGDDTIELTFFNGLPLYIDYSMFNHTSFSYINISPYRLDNEINPIYKEHIFEQAQEIGKLFYSAEQG